MGKWVNETSDAYSEARHKIIYRVVKKIGFYYVTLRETFLVRQNQWSGLTKIDITFDLFEIFW